MSFQYTDEEEINILYEISDNNYNTFDSLIHKVPSSEFTPYEHHRCSIFKKLCKNKQHQRLTSLASNKHYKPHYLDIIACIKNNLYDIAILCIKNKNFLYDEFSHNILKEYIEDEPKIYIEYYKKVK